MHVFSFCSHDATCCDWEYASCPGCHFAMNACRRLNEQNNKAMCQLYVFSSHGITRITRCCSDEWNFVEICILVLEALEMSCKEEHETCNLSHPNKRQFSSIALRLIHQFFGTYHMLAHAGTSRLNHLSVLGYLSHAIAPTG